MMVETVVENVVEPVVGAVVKLVLVSCCGSEKLGFESSCQTDGSLLQLLRLDFGSFVPATSVSLKSVSRWSL